MTPSSTEPRDHGLPAPPSERRVAAVRRVLLHTLPGRLLLVGAGVKGVGLLARLAAGALPRPLAVLETLGSLALIGAGVAFLYGAIVRARRGLLWRVRRKLILSYVFIGVVPALLIVAFFLVSGLLLFLNVASFLVTNGFNNVTNDALYLARVTALEIQRGPGPRGAAPILVQRQATLASRYPGASMVLVPTDGTEPCVGGPAADAQVPALVAARRTLPPGLPAGRMDRDLGPIAALSVGPWDHVPAPTTLPRWVSCAGFGGIVDVPSDHDVAAVVLVRGVGLPDAQVPSYAVIVDIPKNASLDEHLREETSVKIGDIAVVDESLKGPPVAPVSPSSRMATGPGGKRRLLWVAGLQGTNWVTGRPVGATARIEVNVGDIYDRISTVKVGNYDFASLLLIALLLVAVLFLFIEVGALVMGLALARSITGAVHELFEGTQRVRQGDFGHRIQLSSRDQLGELADSFNQMTGSIEDLLRQAEEKRRLEEELRIARSIQMSLLPHGQITVPGLSLSASCVPAREVGGDYYDFLPLDDDRLGVLIADVSGKGTSAALYMAELKGVILSLSRTCRSPRQLLLAANDIISRNLDSRSFITMTYAVIDLEARVMTWARAGHTPLIHRSASGVAPPRVEVLMPDGLVLGLRIDRGELFARLLQEVTLPIERDDVLLFFTDGISEAMNADSDLFGEVRLAALVSEHGHLPAEELRERILREVDAFVAGAPQHDDMTMILIKFEDFVPGAVRAGFDDGRL
jgi:serine phosphatase RsbU (regulator of sigma subunit)